MAPAPYINSTGSLIADILLWIFSTTFCAFLVELSDPDTSSTYKEIFLRIIAEGIAIGLPLGIIFNIVSHLF